jgi:peptidoglycan-associated lipoprotein
MNRYRLATVVLVAPVLMYGCAKHPATMGTMTPAAAAPTGVGAVSPTTSDSTAMQTTAHPESSARSADQQGRSGPGARPAPSEFVAVRDLVDVHFDFDKYAIRPRDAEILDANARWLRANKDALVLIEGHCDARGTEEYNLSLGDRRAKATVDYLVAQGIAPARLVTISYGKERPQCTEHNEACWAKNRRAHLLVKRG